LTKSITCNSDGITGPGSALVAWGSVPSREVDEDFTVQSSPMAVVRHETNGTFAATEVKELTLNQLNRI
jgi:hypothetical protein